MESVVAASAWPASINHKMQCRHCKFEVTQPFVDLGASPPSNAYLTREQLSQPELYFPLRVLVCTKCWLVQTEDFAGADLLFGADYAYFSSISDSWLAHAADYSSMIIKRLGLGSGNFVVEVASNDGYLLKNFLAAGIPCIGIEPTESTGRAAEKIGVPLIREFFGSALALRMVSTGRRADLIIGNNVYAHVPDINDFTLGLKIALNFGGVITLEFPHVMRLVENGQFDTVYHEHFSYFSLHAAAHIFEAGDLRIWDVEEISTHGGSLRIYGCHVDDARQTTGNVARILLAEVRNGLLRSALYGEFQQRADNTKHELVSFLLQQKRSGKTVAAYGAAAKGNTLFNYAGVKPDLVPFVCDAAPSKQGKYMPGSRIPILHPDLMDRLRPDFILILPWNIALEVTTQLERARDWGAKFVVAIPQLKVLD